MDGTLEINTNGGDLAAGGVALAGDTPKFDNVKVGYDNNADDDIDDGGDDLVISDPFDATTVGFTYDDNGNLTDDGTYKYTYDAWNRLVKVTASSDTDIVIQTARFDGLGRRVRKVVTNSGELDGTTVYYHNGNQIIETRDGSGDLVQQMYHGTQYIDELVGLRVADLGRLYVHQDANYNVVALSDMSGRFVERVYYSPYGQPEFVLDAHPFDYDDDGDVDASDIAAATTGGDCWGDYTGQGGDCKRLDADADRDIDADDHTAVVNYVNSLPSGAELQRTPSSPKSTLRNAFAHQGLVLDSELDGYQVRFRWFSPRLGRFGQIDPYGYAVGMNYYSYARHTPYRARDPMGLATLVTPGCPSCACCACGESVATVLAVGPLDAFSCKSTGDIATEWALEVFPPPAGVEAGHDNDPDHRTRRKAYRHCLGQCMATKNLGPTTARKCGDVHEVCNKIFGKQSSGFEAMDQHNNQLGRDIAVAGGNCAVDCEAKVRSAGSTNCPPATNPSQEIPRNQAYTCEGPQGTPSPPNPTFPGC